MTYGHAHTRTHTHTHTTHTHARTHRVVIILMPIVSHNLQLFMSHSNYNYMVFHVVIITSVYNTLE